VHDGVFFEDNGIPVATVISSEFVRAARAQADALGAADYRTVDPAAHARGSASARGPGVRRHREANHRVTMARIPSLGVG